MAIPETTKTPTASKADLKRGYREGKFELSGKPVPNYICVHAPCKHATLDEADAQRHAVECPHRNRRPAPTGN